MGYRQPYIEECIIVKVIELYGRAEYRWAKQLLHHNCLPCLHDLTAFMWRALSRMDQVSFAGPCLPTSRLCNLEIISSQTSSRYKLVKTIFPCQIRYMYGHCFRRKFVSAAPQHSMQQDREGTGVFTQQIFSVSITPAILYKRSRLQTPFSCVESERRVTVDLP